MNLSYIQIKEGSLISDESKLLIKGEPMYNINKQQIMNETKTFNNSKFSDENSRKILVKLIYLLNQGIYFSEQELDELFFRITKLFQSNNMRLREMIYKTLKIIMPQKHAHIIFQCVIRDLNDDNQWFRLQALKFIPFIQNEQYVQQIGRFIHNALLDNNFIISSSALVVGIHIVNKFPNLIGKWLFEVIQRLDEPKQNMEYHALILLHEMKKTNLGYFINIIIQLTNKPLKPLTQLQIIKFIQENLSNLQPQYKNTLINYVIQLGDPADLMLFFQSAQLQIMVKDIENNSLKPIVLCLQSQLSHSAKYLEKYSSLHLLEILMTYGSRQDVLGDKIMFYIQAMAFAYNFSLSQKSLYICLSFYGHKAFNQFKILFEQLKVLKWQCNFLDGLLELIIMHPSYGQIALNFLQTLNKDFSNIVLATIVIDILEKVVIDQKQEIQISLESFRQITQSDLNLKQQLQVIRIFSKIYFNIQIHEKDIHRIGPIYKLLKQEFLQKISDCQIDSNQQFAIIKQNIINLLSQKISKTINSDKNQNTDQNLIHSNEEIFHQYKIGVYPLIGENKKENLFQNT